MANRYIRTGKNIECKTCKNLVYLMPYQVKTKGNKFCSKKCCYEGRELKGTFQKGHRNFHKTHKNTIETIEKMKIINSAKAWKTSGERNWRWIKDRTKVKIGDRVLNDPLRKEWTRQVYARDNFKCKIQNSDCSGLIEAHHILPWRDFVELRYIINNGITLCHFHHPRKREEEKRLSPYFMELVSVSKEQNS